jgi:hypothetical protein
MNPKGFGVYILTYPGDFHLSCALISSIRYFNPDLPMMIIPGEGFSLEDHPFDIPVMPMPDGFWGEIGHIDRKFWSFQGPFERFLYLDADMICTKDLSSLVKKINAQEEDFIIVHNPITDQEWRSIITNPDHPHHENARARVENQLGKLHQLAKFDGSYDPYARRPFNAGVFASKRLSIDDNILQQLNRKERHFYKNILGKPFSWKSHDLFFADQGRLNYLADKLKIRLVSLVPEGNYRWGGRAFEITLDRIRRADVDFSFIHWAGCPRPSPSVFCTRPLLRLMANAYMALHGEYKNLPEIPGYSLWKHFCYENGGRMSLGEKMSWSWRDFKKIVKYHIGRSKNLLLASNIIVDNT